MEDINRMKPDEIAALLEHASDAYYNTGKVILTDDMFDLIKNHLKKIAPKHPYLKQIGAPIQSGRKVELPYWMGSLDKIRDDPKQLDKWKLKYPGSYVVSDKLDGNSALVFYNPNKDAVMYSRGDGVQGQDISHLLPYIKGLPKNVPLHKIAVRGELIISKKDWDSIKDRGANARNVVAGIMHSKNPDPTIASLVEFIAYDMVYPRTFTQSESIREMSALGFHVVHNHLVTEHDLTHDALSDVLVRRRNASMYEIDGIVVVHDAIHKLVKGKNPAYGFAFKSILTHEEAEVIVTSVEWNGSKDGYLKPLVHFDTVVLAGVKISKATGFNAAFIEKNVIGPGSRIVIIRSGDVIPHIIRVISPSAHGVPSFPVDISYKWNDTHVDIMIQGASSQVDLKQLEHFFATLDIKHVAAGTLKKLYANGFDTISKLLHITTDDLLKIDGFKETSAKRIVDSIATIKTARCEDLMVASNIFGRGLGKKKIALIVSKFPHIIHGESPSIADLESVEGVGPQTASAFSKNLPIFFDFIQESGLQCKQASKSTSPPFTCELDLQDQVIVFTGFRNKEWESIIQSCGGKMTTTVSKNTTLLVAANPDDGSSKVLKARELGTKIISKDDFSQQYLHLP